MELRDTYRWKTTTSPEYLLLRAHWEMMWGIAQEILRIKGKNGPRAQKEDKMMGDFLSPTKRTTEENTKSHKNKRAAR